MMHEPGVASSEWRKLMIVWCAYCQRFQGERPPYERYDLTHGLCVDCKRKGKGLDASNEDLEIIRKLKAIQASLFAAGQSQDQLAAERGIADALAFGVQPVDILVGLIAPLLWEIGDLWAAGKITVADEHRFTSFYSVIISQLDAVSTEAKGLGNPQTGLNILLMNGEGNIHCLGVRLLDLWLRSKGLRSSVLLEFPGLEPLVREVEETAPRFFGISIALSEQLPQALRLINDLSKRLGSKCPYFLIGGNAVKQGLSAEPPDNVRFMFDLQETLELLEDSRKTP